MGKKEDKMVTDVNNSTGDAVDSYVAIKEAIIKNKDEAMDLMWDLLDPGVKEQLRSDEDCNKVIEKFLKKRRSEIKKLEKESLAYKFVTFDEFEEWKKKQKKPYTDKVRHIIFVYEVLYPILYDNLDIMFDHISKRAETCQFARATSVCDVCKGEMRLRKKNNKMVCQCGNIKDPDKVKKEHKMVEGVGIDLAELPSSEVYGQAWVKFLEMVIWNHVKKESKKK